MLAIKELLNKTIEFFLEKGGSDIHISVNNPIGIRIKGTIYKLKDEFNILQKDTTKDVFRELINYLDEESKNFTIKKLKELGHCSFAITYLNENNNIKTRFRVNTSKHNGGYLIVLRIIDGVPPEIKQLNFNKRTMEALEFAASRHSGLFLVVGATGSGKSTTLASMIRYINEKEQKNILTLEDPIEYEHTADKCQVVQKEFGRDFLVFEEGLASALREDPDVLLVGEIRDAATLNLSLKAAETGHLVFATLHTNDAVSTIQRISSMSTNPQLTRDRLSQSIIGVIAQKLFVDTNGERKAIWEIFIANTASRTNIKDNKDTLIKSMIDSTTMCQSYNKTIREYYEQGLISQEDAILFSPNSKELDLSSVKPNKKEIKLETIKEEEKEEENKKSNTTNKKRLFF